MKRPALIMAYRFTPGHGKLHALQPQNLDDQDLDEGAKRASPGTKGLPQEPDRSSRRVAVVTHLYSYCRQ